MHKVTVYLPDQLNAELERYASETGRSKAQIVRDGLRLLLEERPPVPIIPILVNADPHFAERVDEHMAGYGER